MAKDRVGGLTYEIAGTIPFDVGRTNAEPVVHDLFDDVEAWKASGTEDYRPKGVYGFLIQEPTAAVMDRKRYRRHSAAGIIAAPQ